MLFLNDSDGALDGGLVDADRMAAGHAFLADDGGRYHDRFMDHGAGAKTLLPNTL